MQDEGHLALQTHICSWTIRYGAAKDSTERRSGNWLFRRALSCFRQTLNTHTHTHTPSIDPGQQDNHPFKRSFGWRPYKEILERVTWGEECIAQIMWPVWGNEWISLFKALFAYVCVWKCMLYFTTFNFDFCIPPLDTRSNFTFIFFITLCTCFLLPGRVFPTFPGHLYHTSRHLKTQPRAWLMRALQHTWAQALPALLTRESEKLSGLALSSNHDRIWKKLAGSFCPLFTHLSSYLSVSFKLTTSFVCHISSLCWISHTPVHFPKAATLIGVLDKVSVHIWLFHSLPVIYGITFQLRFIHNF